MVMRWNQWAIIIVCMYTDICKRKKINLSFYLDMPDFIKTYKMSRWAVRLICDIENSSPQNNSPGYFSK